MVPHLHISEIPPGLGIHHFQGSPFQSLNTPSEKKFLLTPNLNLFWNNWRLLPHVLHIHLWVWSLRSVFNRAVSPFILPQSMVQKESSLRAQSIHSEVNKQITHGYPNHFKSFFFFKQITHRKLLAYFKNIQKKMKAIILWSDSLLEGIPFLIKKVSYLKNCKRLSVGYWHFGGASKWRPKL